MTRSLITATLLLSTLAISAAPNSKSKSLPAPQLVQPAANEYLERGTAVSWRAVADATGYEVEICADAACTRIVESSPKIATTYWQPRLSATGTYHWRVRAIAATPGAFSATRPFSIGLTISGSVFDDPQALAMRRNFQPLSGVAVRLYRDDGDGLPSAADVLIGTTRTTASGEYAFHPSAAGTYWVAADSKTISVPAGPEPAWAEQTYGPAGGQCAQPDGRTRQLPLAGPCVAGRNIDRSDDPTNAATAEHIARITVQESVTGIDFAFSFNIVDSLADSASVAAIQGSLRQFLINANAVPGSNRMRFVPLTKSFQSDRPMSDADPLRWWTITLRRPLPPLHDAGTVIDGAAYSFLSTNSPRELRRPREHQPLDAAADSIDINAYLEIATNGDDGVVCEARCELRHVAIYGSVTSVVVRADATIEDTIVGAHPDTQPVGRRGNAGIQVESGIATIRKTFAGDQNLGGIVVAASGAKIDADSVQIERCGQPEAGAGVVLLAEGSSIRSSLIRQNFGAGIVLGLPSGTPQPVRQNLIADSVISGNSIGVVLAPATADNRISGNSFIWNRFGGVVVAPFGAAPPLRNRITGNRFDENGGRPISLDPKLAADVAAPESGACARTPDHAHGGIAPPVITSVRTNRNASNGAEQIVIQGQGCPAATIELYQSYATSAVREQSAEVRKIRRNQNDNESLRSATDNSLPSIGEFNPIATATVASDGHFEALIPIVRAASNSKAERQDRNGGSSYRFRDVFAFADDLANSAFTALAIDRDGNTSELGIRHMIR